MGCRPSLGEPGRADPHPVNLSPVLQMQQQRRRLLYSTAEMEAGGMLEAHWRRPPLGPALLRVVIVPPAPRGYGWGGAGHPAWFIGASSRHVQQQRMAGITGTPIRPDARANGCVEAMIVLLTGGA